LAGILAEVRWEKKCGEKYLGRGIFETLGKDGFRRLFLEKILTN
jgi:hypothetical protein